jgi:hypothetical protein
MCDLDNAAGKNNEGDLITLVFSGEPPGAGRCRLGRLGRAARAGTGPKSQNFLRRFF